MQVINNGGSGLVVRSKINSNFTFTNYVPPVEGDNTDNLNDAIAALPEGGGVIELQSDGLYGIADDGLNVVDGLVIIGNGASISKYSALNADKYVFEIDTDITVTIKDVTIWHNRILDQSDGVLNLIDVTFRYSLSAGDAYFQTTGGDIDAVNLNFNGLSDGSYFGNDNLNIRGGYWDIIRIKFTGTGNFDIDLNKIENDSAVGGLWFGFPNPEDFLTDFADWTTHNEANAITVILDCPIINGVKIFTYGSADVSLWNAHCEGDWEVDDKSYFKAFHCQGERMDIITDSAGTLEIFDCYMRKDRGKDLVPFPEDIYNEANWGTNGKFVDHIFETRIPVGLNEYGYYPLYIFRNSIIEYMGDDVLNSLDDTQLLAELEANPTYTEDSTDPPTTPTVPATWAA